MGRRAPTRSARVWCESRNGSTAPPGPSAPELGELPEHEEQALLDADGVGDRRADGEPARPPQGAIGQRLEELRCLPGAQGERWSRTAIGSARSPSRTPARTKRSPPARGETGRPARAARGCGLARGRRRDGRAGRRARGSPGGRPRAPAHPAPRLHARSLSTTAESGAPRPLGGRVAVIARASSGSRSSRSTRASSLAA